MQNSPKEKDVPARRIPEKDESVQESNAESIDLKASTLRSMDEEKDETIAANKDFWIEDGSETSHKSTRTSSNYDEYLMAMKRVHPRSSMRASLPAEMQTPRERHRSKMALSQGMSSGSWASIHRASRIAILASLVPDEIIYKHYDNSVRSYETALMFIDVSGFTDLCENYTNIGHGGPSRLTQVLNCYIGAMVQEILTHNGDVLKFSGDAFLSMWKKSPRLTMQDVVHTAIDCGLVIQKNYGTLMTDVGIVLKVKIAISAGLTHFSIIGGDNDGSTRPNYVIVGQPVWDVKMAEYLSTAGDVLTSASAWMYVNEAEYCTQPCGDGRHTKVLGVGATWKRVEKLHSSMAKDQSSITLDNLNRDSATPEDINYREYSLRPAVVAAMRSSSWPGLRRFMLMPVLRAVDNDEPLDFLTEVRRVVIVFLNIITRTVTEDVLIGVVDTAYKCVSSVTSEAGGLVNKVSMFDKDMMFLVVFGLRGLKHEDEAQKALQCAFQLKTTLHDDNISSVSIGVTSGTSYCGLVGHVLRREYTVIGPTVNKAARLMISYPDKITCDKETFLRSKLDQEYFRLMEQKPLKGITKPGPIYEFNKLGWPERWTISRHPLLGRNQELHKYKMTLQIALQQQHKQFTRYRDHQNGIALIGPRLVGKTRLIEECLNNTPNFLRVERVILTQETKVPFGLFRLIAVRTFVEGKFRTNRERCETRIRYSIDITSASPTQIYGINTIFDCRFPLPENFKYNGDILDNSSVKQIFRKICRIVSSIDVSPILLRRNFKNLWVLAVEEAQHTDDESWRLFLLLLDMKILFVVMTITHEESMTSVAFKCLSNNMIVKINLAGVDRWYHAALACQLLDVQAIPADLEKVIESASGGMPGWIQNFVISLVQRGALTVVTVPRSEALATGAVLPAPGLLHAPDQETLIDHDDNTRHSYQSIFSVVSTGKNDSTRTLEDHELLQMAVLAENFNFDDVTVDTAMDVIILKTYDSLTPFEKMLLKCASVLGDVFSRRMLQHLLQNDSSRTVAQAVAKLFAIRVLECEGGDFTQDFSLVMVHPAPALPVTKPPYCACLGTRQPPNCRDLPMYAFCGYMKFRHSLFRTTTYELLTDNQKHEMHARALMFLERYTRRCASCGSGCFVKLLGLRCDDGLIEESEDHKRTRQQICALSAETRVPGAAEPTAFMRSSVSEFKMLNVSDVLSSFDLMGMGNEDTIVGSIQNRNPRPSSQIYSRKGKRVRSFSSLELENCECVSILMTVYCQIIDHCKGAAEFEKLYEAYLEYADLNVMNLNIPQAIRLLFEVETFVTTEKFYTSDVRKDWVMDFQLGRIYSLRGVCMLESGDVNEARKQLFLAMKLYCDPFPTSKHMVKLRNIQASIRQTMIFMMPNLYQQTATGMIGHFYDDIACTLNQMYKLFSETNEYENAALAAKLSLKYAVKSSSNFRLLCISYGNLISTYRQKHKFSTCMRFEKKALEVCHRKRGFLDVTEVQAVSYLYTNIFLLYVEHDKKMESLEFGLTVMHMMTNLIDLNTRQLLILWMLKLLLFNLRIQDMVSIMREFFYMTDYYDLSSETWYHFYAMVILLETGYTVETYATCERFYIKKGDAILRSKTPDAAWNFFVAMWLITIRVGAWEKTIHWEEKIKDIMAMAFDKHEFSIMIVIRLVEGLLVMLVKEMDNKNIKKIVILEKSVKGMFRDVKNACTRSHSYQSRYFLLLAYYNYIKGKPLRAYSLLDKSREHAKASAHGNMMVWADHTRKHWKGTLNPKYVDYWTQHLESDSLLDYTDFDPEKGRIIPYTLPLPSDLER